MGTKSKENIMNMMYHRAVSAGEFRGGLDEWIVKNEKFIDIAFLEVNEGLSYHEAVKKVMGAEKGQKALNKEKQIQEKVTISDIFYEAQVAGIAPKIYAEKLNAGIDRQNAALLNDNEDEEADILREAASAGADISNITVREKILKNFESQKSGTRELTEKEKMVQKVIKIKEDESQKYDFLVSEKIQAGYKGK